MAELRWCMWCGNITNTDVRFGSYCIVQDCPVFGLLQIMSFTQQPNKASLRANPLLQKLD